MSVRFNSVCLLRLALSAGLPPLRKKRIVYGDPSKQDRVLSIGTAFSRDGKTLRS